MKFPWVANTYESIDNYSLKFELYVASPGVPENHGYAMGDWYGWSK